MDASTTAERQYIWGDRYVDDLVLRDRDTVAGDGLEERLYALQDPNWNVVAIAEPDGDVAERYVYSAYGVPTVLTDVFGSRGSTSFAWDNLYTGRSQDSETGLYYYRMRYYGADLGRFLTRDPIGYEGGINLYEYVHDNPVLGTDPSGTLGPLTIYKYIKCQWQMYKWYNDCTAKIPDCDSDKWYKDHGKCKGKVEDVLDCLLERKKAQQDCLSKSDKLFEDCMKAVWSF